MLDDRRNRFVILSLDNSDDDRKGMRNPHETVLVLQFFLFVKMKTEDINRN